MKNNNNIGCRLKNKKRNNENNNKIFNKNKIK